MTRFLVLCFLTCTTICFSRSIVENIDQIGLIKTNLAEKISEKGVSIPADTPFSEYASKVSDIESEDGTVIVLGTDGSTLGTIPLSTCTKEKIESIARKEKFPDVSECGASLTLDSSFTQDPDSFKNRTGTYYTSCVFRPHKLTEDVSVFVIDSNLYYGSKEVVISIIPETNCSIVWGDGTTSSITKSSSMVETHHIYRRNGQFCIKISGTFKAVPRTISNYPFISSKASNQNMVTHAFFGNNCTAVEQYAMKNACKLKSLSFYSTDGITLARESFIGLHSITYLNLHKGIKFNPVAFRGSDSIRRIYGSVSNEQLQHASHCFAYCKNLKDVSLCVDPDSSTLSIPMCMFLDCKKLENVSFDDDEDGTIILGYMSFSRCKKLRSFQNYGSITAGEKSFKGCSTFDPRTIFSRCTSNIGNYAFAETYIEGRLTIPDTFPVISEGCFNRCSGIEEISFPTNIHTIGKQSFSGSYVTEVTIPQSIQEIGSGAFSACKNLEAFYMLGEDIDYIPDGLFNSCGYVYGIIWNSPISRIGAFPFSKTAYASFIPGQDASITNLSIGSFSCLRIDGMGYGSQEFFTFSDQITSVPKNLFFSAFMEDPQYDEKDGTITFLGDITSIGEYSFDVSPYEWGSPSRFSEYTFRFPNITSIPTRDGTHRAFSKTAHITIVVPDSLYESFIGNPTWSEELSGSNITVKKLSEE